MYNYLFFKVKKGPMSTVSERTDEVSSESFASSLEGNHGTCNDPIRTETKQLLTKDYLSRKLDEHQKVNKGLVTHALMSHYYVTWMEK